MITAIATGIRIGWRNAITVTPAQITDPTTITSKTTKIAVSDAHIVLRCQSVGYLIISSETQPAACPGELLFWRLRFLPPACRCSGRGRTLSASNRAPLEFGSTSDKCRRCAPGPSDLRLLAPALRSIVPPEPARIGRGENEASRDCRGKRHSLDPRPKP